MFRLLHHISTDEVYGDLEGPEDLFREDTPYAPSSPHSASKAGSDHFRREPGVARSACPILITNCSTNYGPFHFLPRSSSRLMIFHALRGKTFTRLRQRKPGARLAICRRSRACACRGGYKRWLGIPTIPVATTRSRISMLLKRSVVCSMSCVPVSTRPLSYMKS